MRRVLASLAVLALGVVFAASAAQAEPTTLQLLRQYENPRLRQSVAATIAGTYTGLYWANREGRAPGESGVFCAPDSYAPTGAQLIALLTRYLRTNPAGDESLDHPYGLILLYALQVSFPCPGRRS